MAGEDRMGDRIRHASDEFCWGKERKRGKGREGREEKRERQRKKRRERQKDAFSKRMAERK